MPLFKLERQQDKIFLYIYIYIYIYIYPSLYIHGYKWHSVYYYSDMFHLVREHHHGDNYLRSAEKSEGSHRFVIYIILFSMLTFLICTLIFDT
jgi:hypothetical protein